MTTLHTCINWIYVSVFYELRKGFLTDFIGHFRKSQEPFEVSMAN